MGRHSRERVLSVWEVENFDPTAQERSVEELAVRTQERQRRPNGEQRDRKEHPEWMERQGAESVANVDAVLSDKRLFPWIERIEETERWGDDDTGLKTDLLLYVNDRFLVSVGCVDLWRVQVKSSWRELDGVGEHGFRLCDLAAKRWRELLLIILVGQQTNESIAASFIIQVMNHLHIWGNEQMVKNFMVGQTEQLRRVVNRYLAQDLVGRDWQAILDYVRERKGARQVRKTRFY